MKMAEDQQCVGVAMVSKGAVNGTRKKVILKVKTSGLSKRKCGSAFSSTTLNYGDQKRHNGKKMQVNPLSDAMPNKRLRATSTDSLLSFCLFDDDDEFEEEVEEILGEGYQDNGFQSDLLHCDSDLLDCDESLMKFSNKIVSDSFPDRCPNRPSGSYAKVNSPEVREEPLDLNMLMSVTQLVALFKRDHSLRMKGHTVTAETISAIDALGFKDEMRQQIVNWLMKVQTSMKLNLLCLAVAIHLLYRFLARAPKAAQHLNLSVLTCLWASSKLHETNALSLDELSTYLPPEHTTKDLLACERMLTAALDFRLVCSTALEVAHQTLALCRDLGVSAPSPTSVAQCAASGKGKGKGGDPVNTDVKKYVSVILDACLLDADNWKFKATTKGLASVLAACEFADVDCTRLRAKLEELPSVQCMAALPECAHKFHALLKRTYPAVHARPISPVSIFAASSFAQLVPTNWLESHEAASLALNNDAR